MTTVLNTYQDAQNFGIRALMFDLGQSSDSIKDFFDRGMILRYKTLKNYWVWDMGA